MHSSDDEPLFFDDSIEEPEQEVSEGAWTLLIVDDDKEIHAVTKMALSGVNIAGKRLEFAHAYSGAEALDYLREHDDVALVLLDVVMETDDAGLQVAKAIREELKNDELRIVLRTGQPGYAPEESVVKNYDINDYKTKTELTRSRLLTTVFSSIRSYQQLRTINENRRGLRKIIHSASNLMERHSIINFSEGVVTQIASLLGIHAEGVVGARVESEKDVMVLGAAGHYAKSIHQPLSSVGSKAVESLIRRCLSERRHIYANDATVFFIDAQHHQAAAFIETQRSIESYDQELIEVFLANIAIGFENANLFEDLRTAAYLDTLTSIPNRTEMIKMLDSLSEEQQQRCVAMVVDIDHFSDVNDGLGQDVGNELLRSVARRLRSQLPDEVFVSRAGADVFGLIGAETLLTAEVIESIFESPFQAGEHFIPLRVSCGVTRCACNQVEQNVGKELLKQSYIALKRAKLNSLERVASYHPSMEEETQRRLDLVRYLRRDFSERRLEVWYQPQVSLDNGEIIGAEALLRWPQADGSFISPAEFIPVAEYTGLIVEIGEWVLEQACEELRRFDELGLPELRIAVNVSVPQFRKRDFPEVVERVLQKQGIDPCRLELEITESIVMDDPGMVVNILNRLKEQGVRVAIDDFGVGFSSLSYLQQLPLDRLKIDRTFVNNAATDSGRVIIETIVNMGHRLGMSLLAEGIEEPHQAKYFAELGCAEAQGYFYAKPMNAEALTDLLKARAKNRQRQQVSGH
ncbi:diguanylate phosphodiesterase [Idiomarina tyrosinivorans]|uniref:Diguanylate phosphodiesterase n=1 Tax=Idiomarina tyrosinivorans TaxID=1445662 RepID=A0A432ZS06_9GAMM|nr:EAL domain-containing protein [Idiomarina tyrosinivorans]RUO80653.1 diguanylate phosphodiesterase [Idiomarina tyrosinivorans]